MDAFLRWLNRPGRLSPVAKAMLLVGPMGAFVALRIALSTGAPLVELPLAAGAGVLISMALAVTLADVARVAEGGQLSVCGCRRGILRDPPPRYLRVTRGVTGLVIVTLGVLAPAFSWPVAALLLWVGLSHLIAAVTLYPGCPELGALSSLVLGRIVRSGCGPWCDVDRRCLQR